MAIACTLVAFVALLAGVLMMLWGGYQALSPELGHGLAALAVGAVPLTATCLALAVLRIAAGRKGTPRSAVEHSVEQWAEWTRAHPLDSILITFLAGAALGTGADVRAGAATALAQVLRSPTEAGLMAE